MTSVTIVGNQQTWGEWCMFCSFESVLYCASEAGFRLSYKRDPYCSTHLLLSLD